MTSFSPEFRAWLREVSKRWRGYGQCWCCLEWNDGDKLKEVEGHGWLCRKCQDN